MLGLVGLEHTMNPETTLQKIEFLFEYGFTNAHRPTVIVSFVSLFVLIAVRNLKVYLKRWPLLYRIPEVLVLVLVSTVLSEKFDWEEDGIDILGPVDIHTTNHVLGFPLRHDAVKHYLHRTTSAAVLISIIGFLDSIVAAKQNATRYGYSISPNRELVALGAANLVASFVPGTLPAYGSITRYLSRLFV
jgi:MFS superfamily sulfate permease-like transporter